MPSFMLSPLSHSSPSSKSHSLPSLFLLLLLLFSTQIIQVLPYRFWPPSTRSEPLTRPAYELWIDLPSTLTDGTDTSSDSFRDSYYFYVEQLRYVGDEDETDWDLMETISAFSDDWEVLNTVNCTPRAPYVPAFEKWTGHDWTTYKPEYFRLLVVETDTDRVLVGFEPSVGVVYWDFKYRKLRYDFEFEEIPDERPGWVDVIPVPRTELDIELERQTRIWWFQPIRFTSVASGSYSIDAVNDIETNQAMETNRFRVVFRESRVLYFVLRSWNGFGIYGSTARGLYTDVQPRTEDDATFAGLALICCDESSCPSLVPGFQGVSYQLTSCPIPGNRQLSLKATSVAIIEEHAIYNRLYRSKYSPEPTFVDIELPAGLLFSSWYPWYGLEDSPVSPENGGAVVKRVLLTSYDSYFPLAVDFENEGVVGRQLPVYYKLDGAGAWQLLTVTPKRIPPNPLRPRRLVVAFTWSNPIYYRSLEDYYRLGYNQVARNGYSCDLSIWDDFTPEYRNQNWPSGISFGPEVSLFHSSSATCETTRLFGSGYSPEETVLYASATDDSKFPAGLSGAQLTLERTLWQNALDFYVASGQNHRTGDYAYNGILYRQHLKVFGEYLNYTRPHYLNFDIEDYPSKTTFMSHMHLSQNAQDRRLPGETDEELYDRITFELMTDIANVFDEFSPESKIVWFGTQSIGNHGYSLGTWDLLNSALGKGRGSSSKFIPQPEMYKNHKSPQVVQHIMRGNRLYLDQGVEFLPMPTNGCWGEYSPHLALDWCIQFFANGATGFQIYSLNYINDADDLLFMRECVDLVTPYEDIIMDGSVAFRDLFDVSDTLVVGAIRSASSEEYFLGISPNYQAHYASWEGQFSLRVPGASFVRVFDARQGKYLVPGPDFRLSKEVLTVFFEDAPSTVLHVTIENGRFTAAVVTGVLLAIPAVVALLLFVLVILLIFLIGFGKGATSDKMDPGNARDENDAE